MIKLSRDQVNSWRLSKNHLAERALKRDMLLVVSDACGLQAQVLSGAALSLWARVENITIEDVEDALWKHWTLVKTWAMRGTLHLLSSYSLSTYVAALKTRYNLHPARPVARQTRPALQRTSLENPPATVLQHIRPRDLRRLCSLVGRLGARGQTPRTTHRRGTGTG